MLMVHIIMYARKSAPLCMDVGGAYGGRWAVRVTTRTRPRWWVRRGLQEPGLHNVCAK